MKSMRTINNIIFSIFFCFIASGNNGAFAAEALASDDTLEMKVVIDKDGCVYRYLADSEEGYYVSVQDEVTIPKQGARVEIYSAVHGQGFVYLKSDVSAANVRMKPTTKSKVLCVIKDAEGYVPSTYPCLGVERQCKDDGTVILWFKIKVRGKIGYVSRRLMVWDAVNSF